MCSKSVQVLHRTCKPAASWRFFCTSKRFPFGGWPINLGPARRSYAGPSPSQGRRLTNSGFAAIGILKTLSQNRAIDSARGSFLGKELPTGLRLAEGSAAKPPDLKSIFENPVIVIYLGDFSTHRSCSDFKDRATLHAATARNDGGTGRVRWICIGKRRRLLSFPDS